MSISSAICLHFFQRSMAKEDFWRRRDEEFRLMEEEEKNMLWGKNIFFAKTSLFSWNWNLKIIFFKGMAPNCVPPPPPQMMIRRPDSSDDRHVIAKHGQIYPTGKKINQISSLFTWKNFSKSSYIFYLLFRWTIGINTKTSVHSRKMSKSSQRWFRWKYEIKRCYESWILSQRSFVEGR